MSAPNRNPVSVALEADQSAFQHYKTWIIIITSGYDSSAGYFHVKNSWGSTWGDGVWCLSRSECLFYCVSRSLHQCGILPDSSSSMICVVAALNCVAVIRRSNVSEALYSLVECVYAYVHLFSYIAFRLNDALLASGACNYMYWFGFIVITSQPNLIWYIERLGSSYIYVSYVFVGSGPSLILKQVTIVDAVV